MFGVTISYMKTKPRKILFINPTGELVFGAEASNFELIKAAKKRGFEVYAVLPRKGAFEKALHKIGVSTLIVEYFFWSPAAPKDVDFVHLKAVDKMSKFISKNKVDCIVTNTLNIPWGAVVAAQHNLPHAWIAREFPFYDFKYLEDRYGFIDSFSNLVIANSKSLARYMQTEFGLKQTKQFYSFVDAKKLRLNTKIKSTRIACVGAIHPSKNQLELVQALVFLKKNYSLEPEVLLIGSFDEADKYYRAVRAAIVDNNLQHNIKFTNYRKLPYSLVGQNDIIVQPSKSESLGRVVTEAMKQGLVCVGADINGNVEAFRLGGGNLYQSQDSQALAKTLAKILNNFSVYKKSAKVAQKNALKNLSEEACHSPFFLELEKVQSAPNPQKELKQLVGYFNIEGSLRKYHQTLQRYNEAMQEYNSRLIGIYNSRSWKTMVKLKALLRR